jgi:hypothetical protein
MTFNAHDAPTPRSDLRGDAREFQKYMVTMTSETAVVGIP